MGMPDKWMRLASDESLYLADRYGIPFARFTLLVVVNAIGQRWLILLLPPGQLTETMFLLLNALLTLTAMLILSLDLVLIAIDSLRRFWRGVKDGRG